MKLFVPVPSYVYNKKMKLILYEAVISKKQTSAKSHPANWFIQKRKNESFFAASDSLEHKIFS